MGVRHPVRMEDGASAKFIAWSWLSLEFNEAWCGWSKSTRHSLRNRILKSVVSFRVRTPPKALQQRSATGRVAASARQLAPSIEGGAINSAYVASMVSACSTPASYVFRGGEWRSMYVRAEA